MAIGLALGDLLQFAAQQFRGGGLGVDLVLEILAVLHPHEFMGIAGIAVFAAEFAATVWVDGPGEGHIRLGPVQNAASLDFEILDLRLRFQQRAFGGQFGDPDEHSPSFAFYSPLVKWGGTQKKPQGLHPLRLWKCEGTP